MRRERVTAVETSIQKAYSGVPVRGRPVAPATEELERGAHDFVGRDATDASLTVRRIVQIDGRR